MPQMKALQNIYYHRSTYQKGDEFMALDTEVKGLVDQGFAEVVKETSAPQKEADTNAAPKGADKPIGKMNRTELEEYATSIGMSDLEQYATKAELVEAIEAKQSA